MPEELPAGCDLCKGQPFVQTRLGAGRCSCARGQRLLELEKMEKALRKLPGSQFAVGAKRRKTMAKSKRDAGKAAANDKDLFE